MFLVSTWLHFGSPNPPKSRHGGLLGRLGRVLGRLGRILERLGDLLGRLGRVLERLCRILERLGGVLEASWGVLGASWAVSSAKRDSAVPGSEVCCAARNPPISLKKRTYRPLQTPLQQTQTRSWAASGPVRIQSAAKLRTRHRAACLITS